MLLNSYFDCFVDEIVLVLLQPFYLCQWANYSDPYQLAAHQPTSRHNQTAQYDAVATIKLWHGCWFSGSVSIFAVCGEDWFDFWGLLTSTYFSIWNFQMVVEWWSLSDINWDDGESAWDRCCLQPEWSFQSFNVIGFDFLQATPPGWKPTPDPSQALK